MRTRGWVATAALPLAVVGCGGRLAPLPGEGLGSEDASVDGEDGASPDGEAHDGRGPTPVPVCTGELPQCLAPDAGIVRTAAAVIQCQPEEYVGPWTLVLERRVGASWQALQTQVVEEPGFGATFYDSTGPSTLLTYRVCALASSTTALCGASFTTQGPPNCRCEPTTCYLNTACNEVIDDECGGMLACGPCANGIRCNAYHSCCPGGFMSDGWGGCVCAPPLPEPGVHPGCPPWDWDAVHCTCNKGQ